MVVIKNKNIEWIYPTEYRRYDKDRTIFQLYYNGKWMTTETFSNKKNNTNIL